MEWRTRTRPCELEIQCVVVASGGQQAEGQVQGLAQRAYIPEGDNIDLSQVAGVALEIEEVA